MSLIKTIHKWLSLLVGLQLLIWLGTGLYFNLMDSVEASGSQYRVRVVEPNVDPSQLIEPKSVLQDFNAAVTLSQITLLAKPYYLLTHDKALYPYFKNQYTLVDAIKGKQVLVDEAMARQLATASYSGAGKVLAASKQTPPFDDRLKEKNTLWRVDFDDKINTSVYIDAASGRLAAHSNDDKRFVDIAFMLHFMDYTQEGSFNNVQIIVFAIFTLFFALSGFIWTIELGFNGQYSLSHLLPKRFIKNNTKLVQVLGLDDAPLHNISLSGHENLLDGLIHHDIALPSSCGGGGTCGRCRVKLTASVNLNVKITASDNQQFTPEELALGYRLACQHNSDEIDSLTLLDDTQAEKHQLILASSEFISPFIKELKFKTMSGKPVTFKAGAFMRFFIPAASGNTVPTALPHTLSQHWDDIDKHEFLHDSCSRNYSLANCILPIDGLELNEDVHGNELHFTIKLHQAPKMANAEPILPGVGSHFICNLQPGDSIDAVGPFSEFYAKPISDKAMVMIGAGSGMAPLKSLIEEQLFKFGTSRPIHFFFGARSEADLIYQDYFTALAVKHDHFFYYPVLSRPTGELASEVSGHTFVTKGYVQDRLATELAAITSKAAGIRDIEFYLCGPAAMMTSTIEQLNAYGVKDSQIAFDSFV